MAIFLAWFFLLRGESVVPEVADPGSVQTAEVKDNTFAPGQASPVTPGIANAQTVTRNFTERFGTYSTDVPFTNVEEVQELTTIEYYAQLQSQIYALPDGTEYQGRTTRAIATEQVGGSEESATMTFTVTVQHELTTRDRSHSELQYQTALVVVEKRGSIWLVSSFTWQ
ncbi:TPA: hypothetical protein DEB00_01025 [Candidatus Uhrbacteria bacterium]|nr:hypothetical protein [Candidatus Uhrbacteria bacterium]